MSFLAKGFVRFWSGTGKKAPIANRHPPPWPTPSRNNFRPTPPPKPTTLVGKIKSYIPSRRWLIFGGVIVSWVSLAAYDRRERKAAVQRWCKKVEHLSRRTIEFHEDVPSVGVWISAPPGDQLKWNKEVWRDYVKPIIVAAGFDYSLHMNARQGLSRTRVREMILQHRLQRESGVDETPSITREKEGGDIIVVGRNTFKEVVRGIHEGYLLSLDYVPPQAPEVPKDVKEGETAEPPPPPDPILPAIPTAEYSSLPEPNPSNPDYTFTYIPSLHILGIRHTPKRIYRFLTRRYLADELCEQVVACILEQSQREWTDEDANHGVDEEKYWPKIIKSDAEWREKMVVDSRIRPKLLWRQPTEALEMRDYRQASAPDDPIVKLEELVPTEEELERDRLAREQSQVAKLFNVPGPFGSR